LGLTLLAFVACDDISAYRKNGLSFMSKKYSPEVLFTSYEEGIEVMPEIPDATCTVSLGKFNEVIKACQGSDKDYVYESTTTIEDTQNEFGSGTITDANGEVESFSWERRHRECQTSWNR